MLDSLGVNFTEIIFAIINFLIIIVVLYKFVFKPFLGVLENRKKMVQETYDQAETVSRRADAKMAKYERRIAHVEEEGREIIRVSKKQAEETAQKIIEEAEQKSADMIKRAEETIRIEQANAIEGMRKEIAALSMMAAEKIVGREIEKTGQSAIVDEVINNAGSTKWQN